VNRLRNRLILVFLAATLAPLAATVWLSTALLEQSVDLSANGQLDRMSDSLERTGRQLYQWERYDLAHRVQTGELKPESYLPAAHDSWPEAIKTFAASDQQDRFILSGDKGNRLEYLVRGQDGAILVYSIGLGDLHLDRLADQIASARSLVRDSQAHDWRRGLKLAYILLAASFWLVSLGMLIYLAHRISQPIQQLTAGLGRLASGDLKARVQPGRDDEIGHAILAFNHMADKLRESTDRLVYLGQIASWQTLARKMAHEVKNSLTPIRLTVEEMLARYDEADRPFMEQATQIVVDEIETLERRIRAFSQFAAEPPVTPSTVDVNSVLQERISLLKAAHPEVAYRCRLADDAPVALADQDLLKGILTNLLENAAEAAGDGGEILGVTRADAGRIAIEVHDSGPGLSEQARDSLFQPTISFKKRGMGLGLSIARKGALLSGGDIVVVKGELGGAGFRVLLPVASNGFETRPDRG
jgi:two-component system, NtrC family, nitrogen regulation sensor histidine kinase NtrY